MAQIDALLRMLVSQGGDTLRIEAGRAPVFTAGSVPLRMTFPQISPMMKQQLLAGVVDGDVAAPGVSYEAAGIGTFQVQVSGGVAVFRSQAAEAPAAAEEAPAPERPEPSLVEPLLARAIDRGASDVHLATGEEPVMRIDGRLVSLPGFVDVDAVITEWLDDNQRAALAAGASVDLAREVAGSRLRANIYRFDGGTAVAVRVLRRVVPGLERLGLPEQVAALADLPHGLVLLCGPTGSGKSTTLAALAQERLRRRSGLLVSLEDPIEYTIRAPAGSLVRQRQIGVHARDFTTGLRDALREDPDVLLVGEMRDPESIALAVTAAETGHLVLASLHARNASAAIERMVDAYPPERQGQIRVQLAGAFEGAVHQELVPRAAGGGRVPVVEVLRGSYSVRTLIRDGNTPQLESAMTTGRADGMLTRDQHLRALKDLGVL